jgi:hypothetical protein
MEMRASSIEGYQLIPIIIKFSLQRNENLTQAFRDPSFFKRQNSDRTAYWRKKKALKIAERKMKRGWSVMLTNLSIDRC